jgi:1-acyl-sn-glycerol-3-phosphate acyltransferase
MFRLGYVLAWFFTVTPTLMASLWVLEKLKLPGRRALCLRYYRALCALLRVRIHVSGTPSQGQPTLILANHVSWLDILVLSAICPVAFIAKKEVAGWPIVGRTAKLQHTIFVDRSRRHQTAEVNAEIARRLGEGDPVVLFAEGTSGDGNRVLEFRSALVGAVAQVDSTHEVLLQPVSIGYTRIQGLPMGRQHRPLVAWYGDLDFGPHFKEFVQRGAVDVTVTFGTPVPFNQGSDRKKMTRSIEATVRKLTAEALRARPAATSTAASS